MYTGSALFQGRFQPPTVAHFCTVETILTRWNTVIIGVVRNTPTPEWFDPKWDAYLAASQKTSYGPGKNPFTAEEVKKMWDACIRDRLLNHRVRCDIIMRPYFDPCFNDTYPPERVTLVRPAWGAGDTDMDEMRGKIFPELLKRKIAHVEPSFKLHNTEIRTMIHAGHVSWEEIIAPGAYDVFIQVRGPARISAAMQEAADAMD